MAERRMFSKKIIDSDAFLDMPISAQLLYFHLSMRADDDGFINNPKRIQRMVGCSDDDCKILIAKRFIICFDSGIVVIKHWRIHNYIAKDRYHSTDYAEEMAMLSIKENGAYTEAAESPYTDCIQDVDKLYTEDRLGKDSIDKDSKGKDNTTALPPLVKYAAEKKMIEDFNIFWSAYPKKVAKEAAKKAFKKVTVPVLDLVQAVEKQKHSDQWKRGYIPNPSTWLNQGRWEDVVEQVQEPEEKVYGPAYSEEQIAWLNSLRD